MSFITFTDGSANLPKKKLGNIRLLPCSLMIDGKQKTYTGCIDDFDANSFYNGLKNGTEVKTSLINIGTFISSFKPVLEEGNDVLYVSMSSGISGTYNSARLAAEYLLDDFPERKIEIIDSLGCGMGSGILALKAEKLNKKGMSIEAVAKSLHNAVQHVCQYFTVDDLNFLKRTGRVSGTTAGIATILNIKPILYGNSEGKIVDCGKIRGRKCSIEALAKKYAEKVIGAAKQTVYITHGNCPEDAMRLAERIKELAAPKNVIISQHEPFSGSHVGPGMLGIFFCGSKR